MICAARNAAGGRSRSAERSEEAGSAVRTAQFIQRPTISGVCALGVRPPPLAQSSTAQAASGIDGAGRT